MKRSLPSVVCLVTALTAPNALAQAAPPPPPAAYPPPPAAYPPPPAAYPPPPPAAGYSPPPAQPAPTPGYAPAAPTPAPAAAPVPAAAPAPAAAPQQPAALAATDSGGASSGMPFVEPWPKYQTPPPPPPPTPKLVLSTFFRIAAASGRVSGVVPHLGLAVGGRGAAFDIGYIGNPGMAAIGGQFFRFYGARFGDEKADPVISLFGPTLEVRVITDFGDNVFGQVGSALLGVGVSGCSLGGSGIGYFAQLRGPIVHGWAPLRVNGQSDKATADTFATYGAGLEAGLVFH